MNIERPLGENFDNRFRFSTLRNRARVLGGACRDARVVQCVVHALLYTNLGLTTDTYLIQELIKY